MDNCLLYDSPMLCVCCGLHSYFGGIRFVCAAFLLTYSFVVYCSLFVLIIEMEKALEELKKVVDYQSAELDRDSNKGKFCK